MDCIPASLLRSAIPGNAWPAVPGKSNATLLAELRVLDRTQWWPQERLLEHQLHQLSGLLRHATAHVPYYRERLAGMDLSGGITPELVAWLAVVAGPAAAAGAVLMRAAGWL